MSRNLQKDIEGERMREKTFGDCPRPDKKEVCGSYSLCPTKGYKFCKIYQEYLEARAK